MFQIRMGAYKVCATELLYNPQTHKNERAYVDRAIVFEILNKNQTYIDIVATECAHFPNFCHKEDRTIRKNIRIPSNLIKSEETLFSVNGKQTVLELDELSLSTTGLDYFVVGKIPLRD